MLNFTDDIYDYGLFTHSYHTLQAVSNAILNNIYGGIWQVLLFGEICDILDAVNWICLTVKPSKPDTQRNLCKKILRKMDCSDAVIEQVKM